MSDTQTDDAIRLLLEEQEVEQHPPRVDDTPKKTNKKQRTARIPARKPSRKTAKPIFQPFMRRLWAIVRKHPPTRKQILLVGLALLILLRPWLVFCVILLTLVLLVIVYFSLGPDDCAEKVVKIYQWIARKQPQRAENLRRRASSILKRIGVVLEKLPERWTQGLYLPDLDGSGSRFDDKPDPFDRLAEQAR